MLSVSSRACCRAAITVRRAQFEGCGPRAYSARVAALPPESMATRNDMLDFGFERASAYSLAFAKAFSIVRSIIFVRYPFVSVPCRYRTGVQDNWNQLAFTLDDRISRLLQHDRHGWISHPRDVHAVRTIVPLRRVAL